MASSPLAAPWNGGPSSTAAAEGTIELGVSGMNLVSGRTPALAGSSVSTEDVQHQRQTSFGSISLPNSDNQHNVAHHGSTPPSPSSPLHRGVIGSGYASQQNASSKPPPGYSTSSLPSPIGKSNSSANNTLSSSPILSLTPQSPWADVGHDQHHINIHNDADSFDRSEDYEDDGLRGLGALRERAQSSPGPCGIPRQQQSSPPVRIDVNPYHQGELSPLHLDHRGGLLQQQQDGPRRMRGGNKSAGSSRPPLSGQHAYGDSSVGSYAPNEGAHDTSFEYSPVGAVGGGAASQQMRSRSGSHGSYHSEGHYYDQQQQQHLRTDHAQKFGTLPTLGNVNYIPKQHQHPGHGRSYSHSGPLQHTIMQHHQPERGMEHQRMHSDGSDYGNAMLQGGGLIRSVSVGDHNQQHHHHHHHATNFAPPMQRSVSMNQSVLAQTFDGHQQLMPRRTPGEFVPQGGIQYGNPQPSLARKQMHYHHAANEYGDGGQQQLMQDMRNLGIQDERNRNASLRHPGPRRHSDFVSMSSSPSSGMTRGGKYGAPNQMPGFDDDLTHPLAGELIDDPGDDLGLAAMGNLPGMLPSMHHLHTQQVNSYSRGEHIPGRSPNAATYVTVDGLHMSTGSAPPPPPPSIVYNIKFKRTQRHFVPGPQIPRDLKIGCYVKVEADRGEDLGIVLNQVPPEKVARSGFRTGPGDLSMLPASIAAPGGDLKRIMRLATHEEVSRLAIKQEEEEELLKICRTKVRQRGLPMHVVDAEYQYDRHKLTFFFEAEGRVDFRELVRDLFSMYKTRIWMQQLDKSSSATAPANALAPSPDYGNPSMAQVPVIADNMNDTYGLAAATSETGLHHHHHHST